MNYIVTIDGPSGVGKTSLADATRWRRCDQAPLSAVYVHALRRVPCCCPRDVQLAAGRAAAGAACSYTGTKQLTKS